MIYLFLLPHLFLISGPDWISAAVAFVLYLGTGFAVIRYHKTHSPKPFFQFQYPIFIVFITLLLGVLFYFRWQSSFLFLDWESLPLMPAKRICGAVGAGLCVLALFGTDWLVTILASVINGHNEGSDSKSEHVFIGLTAFVMMTLASKCSPFYAFNDWVDPHTMFTVGKSILHGMLPYRDVYEQKGPLLLLLHSAGALISFDTLLGMWVLEVISCFFFLFFSFRIMRMRLGSGALPMVPVLALIVYTAISFDQGDSAEEFCLPLLAYALWVAYHRLKKNMLPKPREWVMIGVTSGCMLWMKYSMLGFYLGWILALYLFAREKDMRIEILKGIGLVAAGVMIPTVLIVAWFAIAGGLNDLFTVYFYQNIFLYPKTADLYGRFAVIQNLFSGFLNMIVFSTLSVVSLIIGLIWCKREENKHLSGLVIWTFVMMYLLIYFSGRFYSYYPLIFGAFVPFGLVAVADVYERNVRIRWLQSYDVNVSISISLAACVLGMFFFAGNMRSLSLEKEDYPQYKARDYIKASGIENPTLMNYNFLDMGVNTTAGLLPNQRFFCGFNLPLKDIALEQDACLDSGCVDFVLTFLRTIESPNYELAAEFDATYSFGPIQPTYNLYRKR